jgi:hypothetical protein
MMVVEFNSGSTGKTAKRTGVGLLVEFARDVSERLSACQMTQEARYGALDSKLLCDENSHADPYSKQLGRATISMQEWQGVKRYQQVSE